MLFEIKIALVAQNNSVIFIKIISGCTSVYVYECLYFLEPDYFSFNMWENPNLWQDFVLWQAKKCPLLSFIPPLKNPFFFWTWQEHYRNSGPPFLLFGHFLFPQMFQDLHCFPLTFETVHTLSFPMPIALKVFFIPTTSISLLSNILQYLALVTHSSKISNDFFLATWQGWKFSVQLNLLN